MHDMLPGTGPAHGICPPILHPLRARSAPASRCVFAESLSSMLFPEMLEGDNQYQCDFCGHKARAAGALRAPASEHACGLPACQRLVCTRVCCACWVCPLLRRTGPSHASTCLPARANDTPNPHTLQVDATRQLELRSLPPMLCFSLQRFVFDFHVSSAGAAACGAGREGGCRAAGSRNLCSCAVQRPWALLWPHFLVSPFFHGPLHGCHFLVVNTDAPHAVAGSPAVLGRARDGAQTNHQRWPVRAATEAPSQGCCFDAAPTAEDGPR